MGVLEYVWPDFFTQVVETADPKSGRSDLIDEMMKVTSGEEGAPIESKLVAEALAQPGLVGYLRADPRITGEIDLGPYLFLAQTSLARGKVTGLVPVDEKARALANSIESDDPLVTKTAAKQAAAQEPALASSVARILIAHLPAARTAAIKTHMINGLDTICTSHKDQYLPVIKALAQIDPTGSAPVAVAGSAFLSNAEQAGVEVPGDLKDRFAKASPLAAAFAQPKSRSRRPPTGGP
jgi:hypothetical protein